MGERDPGSGTVENAAEDHKLANQLPCCLFTREFWVFLSFTLLQELPWRIKTADEQEDKKNSLLFGFWFFIVLVLVGAQFPLEKFLSSSYLSLPRFPLPFSLFTNRGNRFRIAYWFTAHRRKTGKRKENPWHGPFFFIHGLAGSFFYYRPDH